MTAIGFEEELDIDESPWRGRIITLLALLGITAAVGLALWYFVWREESLSVTRETEEIAVARGTINQTLAITGTADAEFNSDLVFQTAGRVESVSVKVGDTVREGQVLASLESEELANAAAAAQTNVRGAQLKLEDLLAGVDSAEYAQTVQGVSAAQAQLTKAENDYDTLVDGGTAADLAQAQQAISLAEAQLANAQATRDMLDTNPTDADIAAAESGVAQAETALVAAENSAASANNSLQAAGASLKSAQTAYCAVDGSPSFCGTRATPISSGDAAIVNAALSGANALEASGVISTNTAYLNAVNGKNSADAAVSSAQSALSSAQARLDAANGGASDSDIAASDAAIVAAEAGLQSAREGLALVQAGGTDAQRSTAAAAVLSARAALDAAEAARDKALEGADANAVEQLRVAVETAQLQAEAAQIRLKNAQIIAPFSGTVASVNIKPGEFFGGAASTAESGAPIVLLTPDRMQLTMSVGETDYRSVQAGQAGGAVFDGIPGAVYPFVISEIGLSPTVTQGVVTYAVKATLILNPNNPRPVVGMNARGQIITSSKADVLVIPPRAIRVSGDKQVVDVKRDDGTIEEVEVTTGANDGSQVEVLTGLEEGDIVLVVTLTSGQEDEEPEEEPTLPGGID